MCACVCACEFLCARVHVALRKATSVLCRCLVAPVFQHLTSHCESLAQ